MGEVTIITLADNCVVHSNHSARGLLGEHGLSYLINFGGRNILFDTGTGATILHNAKLLGVDWKTVDAIVLSHAHHDHTGGLEKVLSNTGDVIVHVHPDIFKPKYIISEGKEPRYNGLPRTREDYEKSGAIFKIREQLMEQICENIYMIGPIKRERPPEDERTKDRFLKDGDQFITDPMHDEQVLAIRTSKGFVLILGCTHNGLINTVEQMLQVTGDRTIYGIIGGLHLCDTGRQQVKELALWLNDLGVGMAGCSHCTGLEAIALFFEIMGHKAFFNHVGRRIVLPLTAK
ncbi:MAG: MBL fold metallo-hydrolase [Firmicutes bacterium HGW-Firmicutes-14]|nr:MAG: MBL fold metallo-hydrolase [Firmicutes bacterium HGW-Firmicutes-14]